MTIIIISIIILLAFSAFFSGSETGLTGASRAKIHNLQVSGNKRAEMVSNLRKDKDRLIGAILLGNNAVNIAASALATTLAIKYFGDDAVLYVTIIMTFLVLIFAEVIPKTYAFRNAEKVALFVAPILTILVKLFSPITKLVQIVGNLFMFLLGIDIKSEEKSDGTAALRGAIALHHDEGTMVKDDRDMLGSILDLTETEVGEVMLHRKEMKTISIDETPEKIVNYILDSTYTRIPVWKGNPDNIIGIVHSKDLTRALQNADITSVKIKEIMKDPWFIPETTNLKDQLKAFKQKQSHFALVVDEYGSLLGLVTLEDILEEIVGEIEDEHDVAIKGISKLSDGAYAVNGNVTIRDLNRELDWNLPDEEASTIAGLVIHEAQLIPDVKQVFNFHGYRFEMLKKQRNQITSIKIGKVG